jgi:hypothetical protein
MTVRRISSFDAAGTADEFLCLSTPKLAEIVLQHLKSYEGTHTVMQNGMVHRRYFIGMVVRSRQRKRPPQQLTVRCERGIVNPCIAQAASEQAWL